MDNDANLIKNSDMKNPHRGCRVELPTQSDPVVVF